MVVSCVRAPLPKDAKGNQAMAMKKTMTPKYAASRMDVAVARRREQPVSRKRKIHG